MKVTQMPPVHAADLVVNSGNTAYGVEVIDGYLFLLLFNSNRAWLWHQPLVVRQEFSGVSLIEYDMIFLLLYPPNNEVVGGYIGFTPSVRPSVRLSVRPSVRPACLVRSVTSTVLDGFFPY